jgi:hypothetical protein
MELIGELHKCRQGYHKLIEIYRDKNGAPENVVRWCKICGSIVVDTEINYKLHEAGGHLKMMSPLITKTPHSYGE